jgi:hypothetical protein
MDNHSIDSPEQINQALENDELERKQLENQQEGEACNTDAGQSVDKKLDGPNRPSV